MVSSRAQILRSNPTDTEKALWRHLRRRQVDGGQHGVRADKDAERTEWLESRGYRVVRYWNNEVLGNIEGVLDDLRIRLADR